MFANTAVWLAAKRGELVIGSAPYTTPRDNEIVVRNRAVAINPVDWITPAIGDIIFPWTKYPMVLGTDVAGEVVEVGAAVTRFKIGDRVLGHAVAGDKTRNTPAEGAFQLYTVLLDHMASPIPDALDYERAAVLPLGLSTAACGLFQKDELGLQLPSAAPVATGKTVLIWGGSTSVGSNAIQLAVAAGYEVVTTASPKNHGYVKGLGAAEAFDYRSPSVVRDIIRAFKGRLCAGALAIGVGSTAPCLAVVHACKGDKVVAQASPPVSFDGAPRGQGRALWLAPMLPRLAAANLSIAVKAALWGIRTKFIFGTTLMHNEVGRAIYVDFLPKALAEGRYRCAPEPLVVGRGLEKVQAGLDLQKAQVSARKVVVSL